VKLYLIRHAKAEDPGPEGDLARRLTERGREEARRVGEALKRLGMRPALIVASPALRAQETARIVASVLEPAGTVEVEETLAPGATVDVVLGAARSRAGRGDLALVGHQPELGRTAAFLLGEETGAALHLRPADVCGIEIHDLGAPPGRLLCLLTP